MPEGIHLDDLRPQGGANAPTDAGGAAQRLLSRRNFLAGSAAILAGGALVATPGVAKAHNPSDATDIDMLNFALTLEHLEAAFYVVGLERLSDQFLTRPERKSKSSRGRNKSNKRRRRKSNKSNSSFPSSLFANLQIIRDHEVEHVDTLTKVIKGLGGTPVLPAAYDFEAAFSSVEQFLSVAQLLENTGVTAYDGAVAHIEAGPVITGGAQIATVEARHASYLNLINGAVPFPDVFDQPVAPQAVFDQAAAFITKPLLTEPYPPYETLGQFRGVLPPFVVGLEGVVPIPPAGL